MTMRQQSEIETWLAELLSDILHIPAADIDRTLRFDRFGLDSVAALSVTEELSQYIGRDLDPTLLYDYPTIRSLAQHLTKAK